MLECPGQDTVVMEAVQRLMGALSDDQPFTPVLHQRWQAPFWKAGEPSPVAVRPVEQFIDVLVAEPIEGEDKGPGVSEISDQRLAVHAQVLVGATVLEHCLARVVFIF